MKVKTRSVVLSADLKVQAGTLWKFVANVKTYPKFVKFMQSAEVDGAFRPGSSWTDWSTVMFIPLKIKHEILKVEKEKTVVNLIKMPLGGQIIQTVTIEPKAKFVRVKLGAEIKLASSVLDSLIGPILEVRTRTMYEGTLENVQAIVKEGKLKTLWINPSPLNSLGVF